MDRIPPEIWFMIFDKLESSSDLRSVSRTNAYWTSLLNPTKSTWIFNLVFPFLLKYLSKECILQCRVVCKRWCYGVENFLENNLFHRPGLYLNEESKNNIDSEGKDLRHHSLHKTLETNGLNYNSFMEAENLEAFITEARNHPRCPFLGKSASILETTLHPEYVPLKPLNISLLSKYGNQLYFLNISLEGATLMDNIQRILSIAFCTPNLKKLQLKYCTGYYYDNERGRLEESAICQFVSGMHKQLSLDLNEKLPKLETLHVETSDKFRGGFNRALLAMLCSNLNHNLKSLTVFPLPEDLDPGLKIDTIRDLNVSVESDSQMQSLAMFKSDLKQLSVTLKGQVNIGSLFEVMSKFKSSLVVFGISFHPQFYPCAGWSPKLSTFYSPYEPLFNRYNLTGFESLKKICQAGGISPSLNFMCGVNKSLEYLEINIKNLEYWSQFLEVPAKDGVERLDLYEHLKRINSSSKGSKVKIYESNVWMLFPRLKVIDVHLDNDHGQGKQQLEFRRDIYDMVNACI